MTRNEIAVLATLGLVGAGIIFVGSRGKKLHDIPNVSDPRIDPDLGRHRGRPAMYRPNSGTGAQVRLGSAQEPHPNDSADYPYNGDKAPSLLATGYWKGYGDGPVGYSPIDYGPIPKRIPRLWRDGNRYWDGVQTRGYTQQNYRLFLFHLRPSMPTRGYRSISGVLYNGGPTSSRRRIPAVYVPTSVA